MYRRMLHGQGARYDARYYARYYEFPGLIFLRPYGKFHAVNVTKSTCCGYHNAQNHIKTICLGTLFLCAVNILQNSSHLAVLFFQMGIHEWENSSQATKNPNQILFFHDLGIHEFPILYPSSISAGLHLKQLQQFPRLPDHMIRRIFSEVVS